MTTEQIVAIATPMAFNGAIVGVRTELRRVEEVLDARLKHLEER